MADTFDWKITVTKFFKQFFLVGLIAALMWAVEIGLPDIALGYPEYTMILSLLTAVVIAFANYLRHHNDGK